MEVAPLVQHQYHHQLHSQHHLPLERHESQPQKQAPPRLLRQPSAKKVQYFYATPDKHLQHDKEEAEPPVPKSMKTLRRIKRRISIGLTATFNYLAQLDEEENMDECGFIYQYDKQVETLVRPAEERVWIAEAQQHQGGWNMHYINSDDEEGIDERLVLSRATSDSF